MVPHSNQAAVLLPFGFTVPFRVAETFVIWVAGKVRANGPGFNSNAPMSLPSPPGALGIPENSKGFIRKKTGVPVIVHLGAEALNLFKDLAAEGMLFPYLSQVRAGDRATEFRSRCRQLGINGVTLHSYRYAWAERAKTVGYPGLSRISLCSQ